ncbi:hypothetical protein J1605_004943 [Eschrichtius robustus]|uniref:Ankyrin repeat domain-containing protein 45 n=1 Tax=Eschrichtius robustus TaxID=9764 RepID=A0AB34HDE8_ESCRO|nr:hypothetical protein J1605_004943 [Eschrichtius robustus]
MESEGPPESDSSEKSIFLSQQEEEEEDDNEEEESKEAEETATINPLLPPALTGDVEGLQKIFEDPENPHHEQAMQLLLEEDIVGRNLLYAACMAGQSDVIRALAKYGVNLNEKTTRGYTLLHCAAAWGRLETLKALVELDVDIESLNFQEERARDVAARYSQTECVEFLDWAAPSLGPPASAQPRLRRQISAGGTLRARPCPAIITEEARLPGPSWPSDSSGHPNSGRDPWRQPPPFGRGGGDGGEVRCCFQAWAWPVGGCGEGSRALRDTALSLSLGPPAHPPGPKPEGLEGPGEKDVIRLSLHSLP